ncbi:MAG: HelY: helicase [Pseudomonadota bacterium]
MLYADFPVNTILRELERDELLPAILFRTARKQCDSDVESLSRNPHAILPLQRQQQLEAEVQAVISKYGFDPDFITGYPQYQALITTGVGAHHAGQLLIWRLLLEELMSRSMLRLMIATGTVAAGVDFPARTVVVTAHSRRGSEGFSVLSSSEFQQMAGRAGRRGKDAVGVCVITPSKFSDARVLLEVSKRPPEPLRSSYFAAPSTVLNLLRYRNVDDLQFTVERSLAAFLDRKNASRLREEAITDQQNCESDRGLSGERRKKAEKRIRRKLREADDLEQKQETSLLQSLDGLRALGYLEGGSLTEKGYWAAELCTSLVLELAEAISDKLFDDCALFELVGLVASIAGDPHRPYFRLKANPIKQELFEQMSHIVERVKTQYQGPGSAEVVVLPDAALTVITWMDSETWQEFSGFLRLSGVADGDVARLVSQTADHLNQLSRLEKTHPTLAQAAKVGRARLLRPPFSEALIATG